jgi:hypothetical protein
MCFIPKQYAKCLCSTSIHVFCERSGTLKDYRNHIPQHSVEVLEYAVKHGYAELADKAAPNAIGCKATDIANKFSLETLKAWVCLFPASPRFAFADLR